MEELIAQLLKDPRPLLAGLPLKWNEVPPDRQQGVMICALHCCLNGPVGVNKVTTFPMIREPMKIKDLVAVSNKSWKGFCFAVATIVLESKGKIECSSVAVIGTYWPLADWPPRLPRT